MARDEDPPFPRGQTFYSYNPTAIDLNNLGGIQFEGMEYRFEDVNPNQGVGASKRRTSRPVRCRLVRNGGTLTLLPKMTVKISTLAGKTLASTEGNVTTFQEDIQGVVDEYLPATGVLPGDLFWLVVEGPALAKTGLVGDATNVINLGDRLNALSGTTSGATTSGRVGSQVLTGATSVLANAIQNTLGRAMSAATTANTNADILVDVACVK